MASPYTNSIYTSAPWRVVRKLVLARDGHVCQLQLKGCTYKATAVDHTISLADGGDPFDPDFLRATCAQCNGARSAIRTNAIKARKALGPSNIFK